MWWILANDEDQVVIKSIDRPKMMHDGGRWTSCSCGYESREALIEGEKILDKPCVVCGFLVKTDYLNNESMIKRNMCFRCNIWQTRCEEDGDKSNIIICQSFFDRNRLGRYTIERDSRNPHKFKGFGGREFKFKLIKTGEIIVSHNTWFGGEIPKHFVDKFTVNAELL